MRYRQCELHRKTEDSLVIRLTYLPERYARRNARLKLRDEEGVWTDGWTVVWVGELVPEPVYAPQAIRDHRRRAGDSLPKMN